MEKTFKSGHPSKFSTFVIKLENNDKSCKFLSFSSPLISFILLNDKSNKKRLKFRIELGNQAILSSLNDLNFQYFQCNCYQAAIFPNDLILEGFEFSKYLFFLLKKKIKNLNLTSKRK